MSRRHASDWFRSVVLLTVLCAAAAGTARGQGARGGITGIVADPSGAVIPGATVTATNLNTNFVRTTVSGGDGIFLFALLDPGRYRIEVAAQGFKKLTREPITVRVTETSDLRQLALEVGAVTETVNVTGEAPVLQTTAATLGKVFDRRLVADLPLVTRNFTQLLMLQPGVVSGIPNAASFGTGTAGFSVAGSRLYDNSVFIDGVNAMGSTAQFGALGGVSVPSPDAVQEFKVQTQLYSAEYGRAGGASVDLVTKTGTNQFHGNVFEFFRNEKLNANEFFYKASQMASGKGNKAPILRQNQFGGTVGGPIRKDKTFFFFSYQGTRQLNGAAPGLVFSNAVYPRLPAGDRSNEATLRAELGAIYGGRRGFPTGNCAATPPINCILPDGSNINPVAIKILQVKLANGQYMLPAFPASSLKDGAGGINGGQVYSEASFSFPAHYDEDQYMINIDHQISSRQTFSGKLLSSGQYINSAVGRVPGFAVVTTPQNRNLALTHTFTINPTLVNEIRAGYTRITYPQVTHNPPGLTAASVGIKPAPMSDYFPDMQMLSTGVFIGGASSSFVRNIENQYSLSDTISKVAGRHSLRMGGTFVRHQLSDNKDSQGPGLIMQYGFNDFLLGQDGTQNGIGVSNNLAVAAMSGSFEKAFRFSDISYFIQDDWKVRPNFTVNLGLRWDYFAWPHDIRGRLGSFDRWLMAEGLFGTPTVAQGYTGYTITEAYHKLNPDHPIPAGVTLVGDTLLNGPDLNNYSPRVGFAWQPFKRVSLRGGYGIFYPRSSTEMAQVNSAGPPFNTWALASFTPSGNFQDPFTFLNLPPSNVYPYWTPRQLTAGTASLSMAPVQPTARNPYVQQWNLSFQYELARDLLLEIAYMGSHGIKLLNTMAGNQPGIATPQNPIRGVTTNTTAAANIAARAPVAGVLADRGLSLVEMTAASKYNALLVSVTKRYGHGLQFLSSFTYGKSTDSNSIRGLSTVGNAQPPGDNTYNNHWGLSMWDRKVRSTTSFVYELPNPMRNKGALLKKGFGGWQTAAVMTIQSGTPIEFGIMQTYSAVKLQGFLTPNMAPGKTLADVQGSGPIHDRLNGYFASPGLASSPTATQPAGTAFAWPGPLDYGHLGRGMPLRAPGQKSVDFALSKRTTLHEQMNLEFRAEFFNLFNWVNFGSPSATVSTASSFGFIRSTTVAPRIIQFALKLNF